MTTTTATATATTSNDRLLISTNQKAIIGKPAPHEGWKLKALEHGWLQQAFTPEKLIDHLTGVGGVVAPGHYQQGYYTQDNRNGDGGPRIWVDSNSGPTRKEKALFLRSNCFFADFDNDSTKSYWKGEGLSWEDAKNDPLFNQSALFAYTTPSHQAPGYGDRFRVVFRLDQPITDAELYSGHHRAMLKLLPKEGAFDPSVGSPAQCVFGNPGALVHIFSLENTLGVLEAPVRLRPTNHNHQEQGLDLERLRNTLELISSDCDHEVWKTVGSAIRNLTSANEEEGLELWLWWCGKDGYAGFDPQQCESLFSRLAPEPEHGGWGRLETLAGIEFEPGPSAALSAADAVALFGRTSGFKISQWRETSAANQLTKAGPIGGLKVDSKGRTILHLTGNQPIDMTYARTSRIRNNHMLPLLRVLQQKHTFSYDLINRALYIDGEQIPEIQQKTLYLKLSEDNDMCFPQQETADVIQRLALENPFDPFEREMLRIEREVTPIDITNLSSRYLRTTNPLYDTFLEKWLVAFVGRQLQPGLYYRHMLVLKGDQFIGKDAMGQILSGKGNWMEVGRSAKFDNKDFLLSAHSKNLLNFAELEKTTKGVVEGELKSFLSSTEDTFTLKYANQGTTSPRRFSYWGSCNGDDFLTDQTGNTRFHVIPVDFVRSRGEMIDLKQLEAEREGILAGAIDLFREHQAGRYGLELSTEDLVHSENLNQGYMEESVFLDQLNAAFEGRTTIKISEAHSALELSPGALVDRRITGQVKAALAQLGFSPRKAPVTDAHRKNHKVWVRDGCKPNAAELPAAPAF